MMSPDDDDDDGDDDRDDDRDDDGEFELELIISATDDAAMADAVDASDDFTFASDVVRPPVRCRILDMGLAPPVLFLIPPGPRRTTSMDVALPVALNLPTLSPFQFSFGVFFPSCIFAFCLFCLVYF